MKTISILVVALVFCATGLVRAASLDDANRDFAGGQYHAATLGFQAVLAESGYSAPVLFDLGNSYYREGNFPQAILAYQRARWLSPNDPEVTANLQLAQKQAGIADAAPNLRKINRIAQRIGLGMARLRDLDVALCQSTRPNGSSAAAIGVHLLCCSQYLCSHRQHRGNRSFVRPSASGGRYRQECFRPNFSFPIRPNGLFSVAW